MSQIETTKIVAHVGYGPDPATATAVTMSKLVAHVAYGPGAEPPAQPRFYAQIIG